MKRISLIHWEDNIARHGITPKEVEEACFNEDDSPFIRSGREYLHYVFGKTYSGRFLFVVVKFITNGKISIVTARDMNEWERKYFNKRGK